MKITAGNHKMRISVRASFAVILLMYLVAGAALDTADINEKLQALSGYKRGHSRETLIAVEKLIRQSQGDAEQRKYVEKGLAELLESDVTTECKEFICGQLWFIGTEDSVPAIAKLLTDEKTVDMACYAIGQNPSAAAGKALRDALAAGSPTVQVRIINLLGDRKDAQSVEALGRFVLGGEKESAVAAVAALGKIGGLRAREVLVQTRGSGREDLRLAATDAYLQCAEDLTADGKDAEALAIYKELAGKDEAAFVRSAAVQGLADVGGGEAVRLVVAALRDANRMVRTTARGCVRTMQGDGVTQLFAAELTKISPPDQVLLIAALADRGDPAALGVLTKAAKSSDLDVRKAALTAVGRLGAASSVQFLIEAAKAAAGSDERRVAIRSLTVLRGPAVDDAIIKSMQKAKGSLRAELIAVLPERNAVTAVGPLLVEAGGDDSAVRRAAFKALSRLAGEKDLPSLLSLLADTPAGSARKDAERAVVAVARKIADVNDQADAVLGALHGEKRIDVRTSLLRVLGGIGNDKALDVVRSALKDADTQVRDAAVRTLAAWPNAAAAEALLGIYRDAQNQVHRLLSLRGLVRVLSVSARKYPVEKALEIYRWAMKLAGSAQEKKLVLSGLSNVAHRQALEMAVASLDDESVRAEAGSAVVKIAAAIAASDPLAAKAAAQKVLSVKTGESIRKQAEKVIDLIERLQKSDNIK
ncbi:MAG: HEAT repeat domain-containing protein [Phycisphaerae bacterium]|nr:HEAT repeat domain-containing protein [Phycisphaerae bacterium]